jgi:hypothetical protein
VTVKRTRIAVGMALLGLSAGAGADEITGTLHFGKVQFRPTDALAYQVEGKEAGKPVTVVALTDFKIDRAAAVGAIDTASAVIGQIQSQQRGNAVFVTLGTEGKCGVGAFLEGSRSVGLGESFTAKTKAATAARISGTCATDKPGKMFDDAYDFRLAYDVPVTAIPKPAALAAGGGEPGAAYLALIKAIQAADFPTARRHLPAEQIPEKPPGPSEARDYFDGLALNYPKTATIKGGLVKGDVARLEIEGLDHDGKKIKGGVKVQRTAGVWRVVDQGYFFAE